MKNKSLPGLGLLSLALDNMVPGCVSGSRRRPSGWCGDTQMSRAQPLSDLTGDRGGNPSLCHKGTIW